MTTETTRTTKDADRAVQMGQRSLLAMTQLHSRLLRNALEVNAALVDFAQKRIQQDIEVNKKICHCGSMDEAVEVMTGFYQNAVQAYADEASHLMKIGQDAMQRTSGQEQDG